jgi:hypothetical protein
MGLDRVRRDSEIARNLLVRSAGGERLEHGQLARTDAKRGLRPRIAVERRRRRPAEGAQADEDAKAEEAGGDERQREIAMGARQPLIVEPFERKRPRRQAQTVDRDPLPDRPALPFAGTLSSAQRPDNPPLLSSRGSSDFASA